MRAYEAEFGELAMQNVAAAFRGYFPSIDINLSVDDGRWVMLEFSGLTWDGVEVDSGGNVVE
jgi:hypothetical protein